MTEAVLLVLPKLEIASKVPTSFETIVDSDEESESDWGENPLLRCPTGRMEASMWLTNHKFFRIFGK